MNPTSATADTSSGNVWRAAPSADFHAKNPKSSSAKDRPAASLAQIDGLCAKSRLGRIALRRSGVRDPARGRAGEHRATRGAPAVAGLSSALATRFPVVRRLVGDEFFKAMVEAYAIVDPAHSSVMPQFAESFPAFIDHFEPVRPVPYLGDMARLELARALARRAAVVPPLGYDAFTAFAVDRLGAVHVSLHPSLSVVASLHPIYSIWHMNRNPVRFTPVSPFVSEAVLVSRPRHRVKTCRITHGDAALVFALKAGYRLGDAMTAAVAAVPGARPAETLAMLIDANVVVGLDDDPPPAPSDTALSKQRFTIRLVPA